MKKTKLMLIAMVPLLLTGCSRLNKSSSGTAATGTNAAPTALPNSGTTITKEEGKVQLDDSIENTLKTGAIGASISNATLSLTGNAYTSAQVNGHETKTKTAKLSVEVSSLNASAAIEGLTSENKDDVKAYAKADATATFSYADITSLTADDPTNMSLSASIYALDGYTFYDTTGLASLNTVTEKYLQTSVPTVKEKFAYIFDDGALPIIPKDFDFDTYELDGQSLKEMAEALDGDYRDHGDGTYSISDSFTSKEIKSELQDLLGTDLSFDDETVTEATSMISTYLNGTTVDDASTFGYAFVFDKTGLTSFGVDCDLSASIDISDVIGSIDGSLGDIDVSDSSSSFDFTLKFSIKVNFTKGSAVTVETPTNPSTYTLVS